ncbi:MAG: type II toxin-antitoxin system CcdA family antitoxin [Zoogloeaceae bacterium]|jgi:antitoxin CcdA|nr:type II toxin-antitoxin system CcdA family antitoxin [Zoogloeaceae bacterium]
MPAAAKKAANLSLRSDLLEEARSRKINLSQTLERALERELKKQREAEWLEQNRPAIEAYGRYVQKYGLLSDEYCAFAREN